MEVLPRDIRCIVLSYYTSDKNMRDLKKIFILKQHGLCDEEDEIRYAERCIPYMYYKDDLTYEIVNSLQVNFSLAAIRHFYRNYKEESRFYREDNPHKVACESIFNLFERSYRMMYYFIKYYDDTALPMKFYDETFMKEHRDFLIRSMIEFEKIDNILSDEFARSKELEMKRIQQYINTCIV